MYFSDAFPMTPPDGEWFNPLMEIDTQFFVDPFLIFSEHIGTWETAGQRMGEYFQTAFEILAGHHTRPDSLQYRKTVQLMLFPEPQEFGLGFASKGTGGSGTGLGFAGRMVDAMAIAIEMGLADLRHFEELGVLVDNIGRDRISDITCNILKPEFIAYTQGVCNDHGIPTVPLSIGHAVLDSARRRWVKGEFQLPQNPVTGGPVLLTPKRFLRELPSLDAEDWWEFVEPELRDDLNLEIGSRLRKKEIVQLARRHPDLVRRWTEARENMNPTPYDVDSDPEGLHLWQATTRDTAEKFPLSIDHEISPDNLDLFIAQVNKQFKHFIQQQGGWRLLYNDETNRPKRELSIQLLYKGVVQSYCAAHSVTLDREVELGRGPVDFVFSTSSRNRVLLEIKKMQNGEYWNGLEAQLVSYLTSDQCARGWFLAVRFGDSRTQIDRTIALPERTRRASEQAGFLLQSDWVDARIQKSASELRVGKEPTESTSSDPEFPDNAEA
jgi:hypothetical protein